MTRKFYFSQSHITHTLLFGCHISVLVPDWVFHPCSGMIIWYLTFSWSLGDGKLPYIYFPFRSGYWISRPSASIVSKFSLLICVKRRPFSTRYSLLKFLSKLAPLGSLFNWFFLYFQQKITIFCPKCNIFYFYHLWLHFWL